MKIYLYEGCLLYFRIREQKQILIIEKRFIVFQNIPDWGLYTFVTLIDWFFRAIDKLCGIQREEMISEEEWFPEQQLIWDDLHEIRLGMNYDLGWVMFRNTKMFPKFHFLPEMDLLSYCRVVKSWNIKGNPRNKINSPILYESKEVFN